MATDANEPAWVARMPATARARMREGTHPADPRRTGSSIAVVGGLVFVWANGDDVMPAPLLLAIRVAATALALFCVWRLFIAPLPLGTPRMPHRFAGLIYLASVAAMLLGIGAGRMLLSATGHVDGAPAWIAVCVGLHLIPFAWAFREPMLLRLGLAVAVVGAAATALAIFFGVPWGSAGAVTAGLVQLAVLAAWVTKSSASPRTSPGP